MKKLLLNRKVLMAFEACLIVILVVSVGMMIRTQMEYREGESVYEEATVVAELPQLTAIPAPAPAELGGETAKVELDPNMALLAKVDLEALREENPDVLGWISIPETELSYPVLQGTDNDYYLVHSWKNKSNSVGSIFMDYRSNADMTDFNTVIYGHRMRNGSMFASLKYYSDQEHWRTHPSIYLAGPGGVYRYDIFAAYEASVLGPVYDLEYEDAESKAALIESCLKLSVIETGIVPTEDDQILTLSTCTGNGYSNRWVVQAVLAEYMPILET